MASNLRVDSIVPATGTNVSIGTATGGVNIPGVLTYEDVTNVDSVGVITARSGIRIGTTGANTLIRGNATGIGIGTDNPDDKLTVRGSNGSGLRVGDGTANVLLATGAGPVGRLYTISNHDLIFGTNDNERLRIGSAGQLGIGGANYGTSGQVLTSQGSGSAVQWATPGLAYAQQWHLTANGNASANTDNVLPTDAGTWEKRSQATNHAGTLGSDMTYDGSGVFAFPLTGIWKIEFYGYWGIGSSDSDHNLRSYIQTTINNSSFSNVQEQVQSIKSDSTYTYQGWFQTFIFDVTSTSNCKVRFVLNPSGSNCYYKASNSPPQTGALFMRLGDT